MPSNQTTSEPINQAPPPTFQGFPVATDVREEKLNMFDLEAIQKLEQKYRKRSVPDLIAIFKQDPTRQEELNQLYKAASDGSAKEDFISYLVTEAVHYERRAAQLQDDSEEDRWALGYGTRE